jgi:hypothetical protein
MPSASLSPQEANDLLHKLVTESTRVQGAFVSPVSVYAIVWGVIRVSSTGLLNIVEREDDTTSPILCFDPSRAVWRKYVDERSVKENPAVAEFFEQHFSSAVTLAFEDGSLIALLEFADKR